MWMTSSTGRLNSGLSARSSTTAAAGPPVDAPIATTWQEVRDGTGLDGCARGSAVAARPRLFSRPRGCVITRMRATSLTADTKLRSQVALRLVAARLLQHVDGAGGQRLVGA